MTKNFYFWSIGTVKVAPDKETMWLKVEEMAKFFDRDRSVIQRPIRNIFKENELEESRTYSDRFSHYPQLVQNLHKFKMKVTGLSKELLITTILI